MSLLNPLFEAPDERPDAIQIDGHSMSGEALLRCASAVADRIYGAERVAIEATATLQTVVGVVGALLAGATVVVLPAGEPPAIRRRMTSECEVSALLAPDWAATGPGELPVLPIDLAARSGGTHSPRAPGRAAVICYTAGTSGAAKPVIVPYRAIAAGIDSLAGAWSWTPDDVLVHGLPLGDMAGLLLGILGPLRLGSRVVHVGRPTPAAHAGTRGTLYVGVPETWSRLSTLSAPAARLEAARLLVSTGPTLPPAVAERLHRRTGHRVAQSYATTETLVVLDGIDGAAEQATSGRPLPGVDTRLAGADGTPVPADGVSAGELLVRGPSLFSGYAGGTPTGIVDGWYPTGDLATVLPDGRHRVFGRARLDVIHSGRHRIGAGEVEHTLLTHPAVSDVAVVGTPHPILGEQVTAFVVADGVRSQELIDFVGRNLDPYKRPRAVHLVRELPRTQQGRVRKWQLVGVR